MRSGALITAGIALHAGRATWAVPGSVRNAMAKGPNELIRRGEAALVTSAEHVFEDVTPPMVWEDSAPEATESLPGIAEEELAILLRLDDVPAPPEVLLRDTDLNSGRGALVLTRLEVRGYARRDLTGYAISASGAKVRNRLLDRA